MDDPESEGGQHPLVSQETIDKSNELKAQFEADAPLVSVNELPLLPKVVAEIKGFAQRVAPLNPTLPASSMRPRDGRLWERFFLPNENVKTEDAYSGTDITYWSPEGEPDKIIIQYPHKKTPEEDLLYDDPHGHGGPTRFETELKTTDEGTSIKTMLWGSEDFPGRHIYGVWVNDPEDCQRLLDFLEQAPNKLSTEEPLTEEQQQANRDLVQGIISAMEQTDIVKKIRGKRKRDRFTAMFRRSNRR
jgi:hypothetical protein